MFDLLIGTALVLGQVPIIDLRTQPLAPLPAPAQESVFVPPPNIQGQVPTIDLRTQPLPALVDPAPKFDFLPPPNLPVAPLIPPEPVPVPAANSKGESATKKNGDSDSDKDKKDDKEEKKKKKEKDAIEDMKHRCFVGRVLKTYCDDFKKKDDEDEDEDKSEPKRRAFPSPWSSPPFPGHEYQGYPQIGVPVEDNSVWPLMQGLLGCPGGDCLKDSRINVYGWVTGSGNYSTNKNSNVPTSYFIVPNRLELDQAVLRVERQEDTVQTDHVDWGFRLTDLYGIDYRYTTAGGYFSQQLLKHNLLYGDDPLEIYGDLYIPNVAQGLVVRLGRYISPPDIEAQLAPDNYLASHSILFTYDAYTQTGLLATLKLNDMWTVQAGIHAGNDMAPWYKGAVPTGIAGVRWISRDNKDSVYSVLNAINSAKYRSSADGGHDNFNYFVSTWTHTFSKYIHTSTEAYYLWTFDGIVGGTANDGPIQPYGGGGGPGAYLPGLSSAFGVLNYTMFQISNRDYFTVRNEWYRDDRGERTGYATSYTSDTVGISHQFNDVLMLRPEVGYYHSWNTPAFDNGTRKNMVMFAFDVTLRF